MFDFLFSSENSPVFVAEIIKKKEKSAIRYHSLPSFHKNLLQKAWIKKKKQNKKKQNMEKYSFIYFCCKSKNFQKFTYISLHI